MNFNVVLRLNRISLSKVQLFLLVFQVIMNMNRMIWHVAIII